LNRTGELISPSQSPDGEWTWGYAKITSSRLEVGDWILKYHSSVTSSRLKVGDWV